MTGQQYENRAQRYNDSRSLQRGNEGVFTSSVLWTAVAVGLGIWAWTYLGPDLRRYIKISRM